MISTFSSGKLKVLWWASVVLVFFLFRPNSNFLFNCNFPFKSPVLKLGKYRIIFGFSYEIKQVMK